MEETKKRIIQMLQNGGGTMGAREIVWHFGPLPKDHTLTAALDSLQKEGKVKIKTTTTYTKPQVASDGTWTRGGEPCDHEAYSLVK